MRPLLTPLPLTIPVPDILRERGLTDEAILHAQQPALRALRYKGWEVEEIPVEDEFTYYEDPWITRHYVLPITHSEAWELEKIAMAFESDAFYDDCDTEETTPTCSSYFNTFFKGQKENPPPTLAEILEGIRGYMKSVREQMVCIEERLAAIETRAEIPS